MDEDERLEELLNEMDSDELDAAFERAMDAALERTMEAEMNLEAALSGSLHYGHIDTDLLLNSSLWREPDYGFTVHNNYEDEIFNLPEIPPGVQTPPVIHHGERIRPDDLDWFRSMYADKSEVIKNFNKKCERCKKEDCVVINCFVEYIFENYKLKRKN